MLCMPLTGCVPDGVNPVLQCQRTHALHQDPAAALQYHPPLVVHRPPTTLRPLGDPLVAHSPHPPVTLSCGNMHEYYVSGSLASRVQVLQLQRGTFGQ